MSSQSLPCTALGGREYRKSLRFELIKLEARNQINLGRRQHMIYRKNEALFNLGLRDHQDPHAETSLKSTRLYARPEKAIN